MLTQLLKLNIIYSFLDSEINNSSLISRNESENILNLLESDVFNDNFYDSIEALERGQKEMELNEYANEKNKIDLNKRKIVVEKTKIEIEPEGKSEISNKPKKESKPQKKKGKKNKTDKLNILDEPGLIRKSSLPNQHSMNNDSMGLLNNTPTSNGEPINLLNVIKDLEAEFELMPETEQLKNSDIDLLTDQGKIHLTRIALTNDNIKDFAESPMSLNEKDTHTSHSNAQKSDKFFKSSKPTHKTKYSENKFLDSFKDKFNKAKNNLLIGNNVMDSFLAEGTIQKEAVDKANDALETTPKVVDNRTSAEIMKDKNTDFTDNKKIIGDSIKNDKSVESAKKIGEILDEAEKNKSIEANPKTPLDKAIKVAEEERNKVDVKKEMNNLTQEGNPMAKELPKAKGGVDTPATLAETPKLDKSAEEKPKLDKPAEEKPKLDKPAEEKPKLDKPAEGKKLEEGAQKKEKPAATATPANPIKNGLKSFFNRRSHILDNFRDGVKINLGDQILRLTPKLIPENALTSSLNNVFSKIKDVEESNYSEEEI